MLLVLTLAIFLAAGLLFCVQPMLGRLLLPRLGGSPAVWTSAMVFFQGGLLVGYMLAHGFGLLGGRRPRLAIAAHVVLAALAVVVLPVSLPGWSVEGWPALWVIGALAVAVGLPYVMLATVSPAVQRWISATDHRLADDPYPLYAASNAGSLLGLVAYPLVIEGALDLDAQGRWFSAGYVAVVVLLGIGGLLVGRRLSGRPSGAAQERPVVDGAGVAAGPAALPGAGWPLRLAWVGLAAVPSSLMLGTTLHLTTDVAAVPLLWVVPLSLYLGTFIVAFGCGVPQVAMWTRRLAPVAVVAAVVAMLLHARQPLWAVAGVHLAAMASASLLCHLRLAELRPPASRLTEFYLLVATGGVLGGAFNALVAPAVFDRVYEYPLALGLSMLALPGLWAAGRARGDGRWRAMAVQALVGVVVVMGFAALLLAMAVAGRQPLSATSGLWERALAVGVPALGLYLLQGRPAALAMAVCGVLVVGVSWSGPAEVVHVERTFFGVHTVERVRAVQRDGTVARFHQLRHGSTAHGIQRMDPGYEREPLAYYHRQSPIAEVFALIDGQAAPSPVRRLDRVALVGLGTGALAAYGRPGMTIDAYEIDPAVVRIAQDRALFTYLSASRADAIEVVVGDGRLRLSQAQGKAYDLIVLDAFSSDAIPVHLLTVEAFGVYLERLAEGGVLAVHVSNVYLDLEPVVASAAARLGLVAQMRVDQRDPLDSQRTGRYTSAWIMLARDAADLGPLVGRPLWRAARAPAGFAPWTDQRSNILDVLGQPPQE